MSPIKARTVDHRTPIHDNFCRCRICKPPLVGRHAAAHRLLTWQRFLFLNLAAAVAASLFHIV